MVSQGTGDSQSDNWRGEGQGQAAGAAPRLLVDAMLGRLARWLRLAGYDAEFWRDGSDEALIAAARATQRMILTKDRALAGRRGVLALLIRSDDLDGQMAEARTGLAGRGAVPEPFTRCGECNGLLTALPHAEAEGRVPPYVWQTQAEFWRCTGCGRIYWKGTHWPAVHGRLFGGDRVGEDQEGEGSS